MFSAMRWATKTLHIHLLLLRPLFQILEAIVANQLKKFVHPRVRNMHENTFTRMEAGAFIKPTVTQQSGFS